MIRGDEWKGDLMAPNGKRDSPAAPSASGPKWTAAEVDCIVLAFDACKTSAARFHAEFNDITEGRQRTLAELRLHLPRVAKARGLDVPQKFLDDCDAVIDGVAPPAPPAPVAQGHSEAPVLSSVELTATGSKCRRVHIGRGLRLAARMVRRGFFFYLDPHESGVPVVCWESNGIDPTEEERGWMSEPAFVAAVGLLPYFSDDNISFFAVSPVDR